MGCLDSNFDNELKVVLLDMMKWLHGICVENKLRYYALGGTMLGAARHQGFIPWDDDIDIGMPRRDYEKLIQLLKGKTGRYILESPEEKKPDFFYTYAKLYDTNTTLVEKTKCNIKRGVFIDIFPLDGLADTLEESNKIFKNIDFYVKLLLTRVTAIRKNRSFYKNAIAYFMQLLPNFLIDEKKVQLKIVELCKEHDFDSCEYGGNLLGHWRFKEVMSKSIMGVPTLYKFEDMEIYGAEDYNAYLTHLYGEWEKLPPVEQRKTLHDFIECDLHKSYLN